MGNRAAGSAAKRANAASRRRCPSRVTSARSLVIASAVARRRLSRSARSVAYGSKSLAPHRGSPSSASPTSRASRTAKVRPCPMIGCSRPRRRSTPRPEHVVAPTRSRPSRSSPSRATGVPRGRSRAREQIKAAKRWLAASLPPKRPGVVLSQANSGAPAAPREDEEGDVLTGSCGVGCSGPGEPVHEQTRCEGPRPRGGPAGSSAVAARWNLGRRRQRPLARARPRRAGLVGIGRPVAGPR
jgi:hypothetical protein